MPIKTRIDMLSTGLRALVGIKVYEPALGKIEEVGIRLEDVVKQAPGTVSVFSGRVTGALRTQRHGGTGGQWPARSAAY